MSLISRLNDLEQEVKRLQENQKEKEDKADSFFSSGQSFAPTDPIYLIQRIKAEVISNYEKMISLQNRIIDSDY